MELKVNPDAKNGFDAFNVPFPAQLRIMEAINPTYKLFTDDTIQAPAMGVLFAAIAKACKTPEELAGASAVITTSLLISSISTGSLKIEMAHPHKPSDS